MIGATYFTSAFLVLVARICVVSSRGCTQITSSSGTIADEKWASTYSSCWKFNVPHNRKVSVTMTKFSSSTGVCTNAFVKVSLNNKDEAYIFCPNMKYWSSLSLTDDFTVTHSIKSEYEVWTSKFSLTYEIENVSCSEEDDFECNDGTCILQSQICDGTKQCSDGVDEQDCGSRTFVVPDMTESRVKGIQWLKDEWSHATGWQENTHRGIAALFLASERNERKVNVEEKLMIKQLEVQTFVHITRNETDKMTVNQLSMFVNALTVSCKNPYNFYGHDLVKLLKDEVEISSTITNSVAYLALCNAGATLPVNATHNLSNLLTADAENSFLLDVQAVTIMVMSCLKANSQTTLNDSFLHTDYEEAVAKLKGLQFEDGSFGNIYTTAVVTQALLSAGQENSKDWDYNKAIKHLIHHLKSPSSDFLAVYWILPILNSKCLSDIRNTNCSTFMQRDDVTDVKSKLGSKMRIQYTLNIGNEKDIVHTISLRVPENITVLEVMQLAQDADAKYKFLGKKMGEKLYIYGIAGKINDFEDDKFWLLYVGKDAKSMRYTNESPDKINLQDGAQITMWYKKAHV